MTVSTPLYGLTKFAPKEPAALTATIVNASVDKIEEVLQGAGIVPPSADLDAMLDQLSAFNALNAAGAFTDSGWVAVPIGAVAATTTAPAVRKFGKQVIPRGGWVTSGLAASSTTTLGTIPAGYRPATDQHFVPGMSAAGSIGKIVVATTGVVSAITGATPPSYMRWDAQPWTVD